MSYTKTELEEINDKLRFSLRETEWKLSGKEAKNQSLTEQLQKANEQLKQLGEQYIELTKYVESLRERANERVKSMSAGGR